MSKFFNPLFWFNQRPGLLIPLWRNTLIAVLAILLALAITSFILKKKSGIYAKLWDRIFNLSSTNLFIGLVLFFFNAELVPLLSARFWYLLWVIGMGIWTFFTVRYAMTLPQKKKEFEKRREFEKYLPK